MMRKTASKIIARDLLPEKLAEHKRHGRRIVFANGCFDMLHVGHIRYLEGARREGDVLVVGVNADSSVCDLKGPGRPSSMGTPVRNSLPRFAAWITSYSSRNPTSKFFSKNCGRTSTRKALTTPSRQCQNVQSPRG